LPGATVWLGVVATSWAPAPHDDDDTYIRLLLDTSIRQKDRPMINLSEAEREIVDLVARYVDSDVRPVVRELEQEDTYPEKIIEQMKEMGVYGMCIPAPYGEFGVSTPCFVLVTEELARGWMSLAGAFGGHAVVSKLILRFGSEEQRRRYLPPMATGELRAAMALTEPGGGSDLQAIRTTARRDGNSWVISGSKMWITNARRAGVIAVLCKTDASAVPAHNGISILLVEADAGYAVSAICPSWVTRASRRASCPSTSAGSPTPPSSVASRARASRR